MAASDIDLSALSRAGGGSSRGFALGAGGATLSTGALLDPVAAAAAATAAHEAGLTPAATATAGNGSGGGKAPPLGRGTSMRERRRSIGATPEFDAGPPTPRREGTQVRANARGSVSAND